MKIFCCGIQTGREMAKGRTSAATSGVQEAYLKTERHTAYLWGSEWKSFSHDFLHGLHVSTCRTLREEFLFGRPIVQVEWPVQMGKGAFQGREYLSLFSIWEIYDNPMRVTKVIVK